jgi:hypothetical protein
LPSGTLPGVVVVCRCVLLEEVVGIFGLDVVDEGAEGFAGVGEVAVLCGGCVP